MTETTNTTERQSLSQMFSMPAALAVLSAVGLVSALVGDGTWDVLSWLTLAAPAAVPVYFIARGRS
jgi:hypothetical protein